MIKVITQQKRVNIVADNYITKQKHIKSLRALAKANKVIKFDVVSVVKTQIHSSLNICTRSRKKLRQLNKSSWLIKQCK